MALSYPHSVVMRIWKTPVIFYTIAICLTARCLTGAEFQDQLDGFFEAHCYDCHDGDVTKGGLDLLGLGDDLTDAAVFAKWERIYDRVARGEMPPAKKPRPGDDELANFRRTLAQPLATTHEKQKGTVLRRLNRQEYQNTLNDIFGTSVALANLLPEDGRSHEFDNIGSALGISMVQMQRYLEGIEQVLDAAIADKAELPEPQSKKADYATSREGQQHIPKNWGKAPDGATVFYRQIGYPTGMLRDAVAPEAGYYRVRVTGYAHQSDEPITFSVGSTTFQPGAPRPTYGYYAFEPGAPQTIEMVVHMAHRYMIQITPWGLTDEDRYIRDKKTTVGYQGPGLAINHVEIEGPLVDQYPSRGHELLFTGIDRRVSERSNRWNTIWEVASDTPLADAEMVLLRVAEKAFRRPVEKENIVPYLQLFQSQYDESQDFEKALRAAVSAIFMAPDFLYLRESPGWLDDYALASRLAYAFTRSSPDEELLAAAAEGRLAKDPEELWRQTERLMAGEHFERFITDYTDAWLNLREIEFTTPDKTLFPEYDAYLQFSLLEETRSYFRNLIAQNLPARNIAASGFAMLNERLADHYGIDGVAGPDIRTYPLPAGSNRGGFITQGSVLKVSANGTNTSPVMRGVWVLERILGQTPAPPPPGIPGVEPDIRGAETLRQLLDQHRDSESCQSCHQTIDPPGFALESFDPIGGWRENFRSLSEGQKVANVSYRIGPPVDSSGQMPDGRPFSDFGEFQTLLAEDEDQLAKAFAYKLLSYSTGREMGFSDRPKINQIVKASAQQGHGIKDLIRLVVFSDIFRRK